VSLFDFFAYIDPTTGVAVTAVAGGALALALGFIAGLATFVKLFFKKIYRKCKKHPFLSFVILLIIAICIYLTSQAIFRMNTKNKFQGKIIVLGFDALDPDYMKKLFDEGKLPNLNRLNNHEHFKTLATTNPSQSPVAWTSFATGQNPGKHGIYDFIVRNPATYKLNLSLTKIKNGKAQVVRQTKAWWEYASQKGVEQTILHCPVTFPAEKIHGKMLSGMGVPDIIGTQGTFTFYTSESMLRDHDVGGRVIPIKRDAMIHTQLYGPKVAHKDGLKTLEIPMMVNINENDVLLQIQDQEFRLKKGQISDWVSVTFKAGWFKKINGICKIALIELSPNIKFYVSPVNLDPRKPHYTISYPTSYSQNLAEAIGLYHTQGMPFDTWAVNELRIDEPLFLKFANEIFDTKKKMFLREWTAFQKGIFFMYFEDADILQHMFYRYVDEESPLFEEGEQYRKVIENIYEKLDSIVGELMPQLAENDTLIILSDHGFGAFRRAVHLNTWLRQEGYLQLKNPMKESGSELFEDVDWSKTRAYALGFGAIYINLQGREGEGIVAPGAQAQTLKKEIAENLLKLYDTGKNQKVVSNVYKNEEIFWGPHSEEAPDLYVGFAPGYRASWQTAMGAVESTLIEDNLKKWSGDHLCDPVHIPGVLFSNKSIKKENPSIMDIAPTILKLCGYSDDEIKKMDMDGSSVF